MRAFLLLLVLQCTGQCGDVDTDGACYVVQRYLLRQQLEGCLKRVRCHGRRPATHAAASPRSGKPGFGPLRESVAFILGWLVCRRSRVPVPWKRVAP